jgi:hypothetical protein
MRLPPVSQPRLNFVWFTLTTVARKVYLDHRLTLSLLFGSFIRLMILVRIRQPPFTIVDSTLVYIGLPRLNAGGFVALTYHGY